MMKTETEHAATGASHDVHPPIIRVVHWINAIAIIIMIGSGWRIYNDSPLIEGFYFPDWFTLGGDPAISDAKWQNHASGGLLWHFAAMWLLVLNVCVYAGYGIWSGRLKRMLWPITVAGVLETLQSTLRFELKHEHGVYNHVQRVMYVGVMVLVIGVILSGLAIWKPVQFQTLLALFGSFQGARWVHFLCMTGIVAFLLVHVALALLVPRTLLSMTVGEITPEKPATPKTTR